MRDHVPLHSLPNHPTRPSPISLWCSTPPGPSSLHRAFVAPVAPLWPSLQRPRLTLICDMRCHSLSFSRFFICMSIARARWDEVAAGRESEGELRRIGSLLPPLPLSLPFSLLLFTSLSLSRARVRSPSFSAVSYSSPPLSPSPSVSLPLSRSPARSVESRARLRPRSHNSRHFN